LFNFCVRANSYHNGLKLIVHHPLQLHIVVSLALVSTDADEQNLRRRAEIILPQVVAKISSDLFSVLGVITDTLSTNPTIEEIEKELNSDIYL